METFTVRKLAGLAGVGTETVRFYERRQLLPPPARNASGYRQYTRIDVERLIFIRRAKDLGFTLREIKDLARLRDDPEASCGQVFERAQAKIQDIGRRIASLEAMREELERLAAVCAGNEASTHCRLLEELVYRGDSGTPPERIDR